MKKMILIAALVSGAPCAFAQSPLRLKGPYADSFLAKVSEAPRFQTPRLGAGESSASQEWNGKHLLSVKDFEVRVSLSQHVNFEHAGEYNAFHPEFRINFKEGVAVGAYRNSNYYWSPYVSFRLYNFTESTSVNAMVAWYGEKSVPVLVWKTEIFRGVELFAITHPLLETSKVVAGVSFSQRF